MTPHGDGARSRTGAGSQPLTGAVVLIVLVVVLWTWFRAAGLWGGAFAEIGWIELGLGLALSCIWILARFLRWQFLLRRAGVRVPIRSSLLIYLAGLPGLATPGMAGEIVRVALLQTRHGVPVWRALDALLTARVLDVATTVGLAAVYGPPGLFLLAGGGVVALGVCAALRPSLFRCARALLGGTDILWAAFATALVWGPLALLAFAEGRSDAPLALFLTGGASNLGTLGGLFVAFPGLVGLLGIVLLLRTAVREESPDQTRHFDAIAADYLDQWSPHVWSHLIGRKVDLMAARLEPGMIGLDLGCGAGLQVAQMERRGFHVVGIDPSRELVRLARREGALGSAADGRALPFASASFDFVYAVGVLHHVPGVAAQAEVLHEVRRVLKPGGQLLVHETNPRNPLFRFYMGYVFPLLKDIDEGTEWWIDDRSWRGRPGFSVEQVEFFTFIPDFLPEAVMKPFLALESRLEGSPARAWSVHYFAAARSTGDADTDESRRIQPSGFSAS